MKRAEFDNAITWLRSSDSMTYENGFHSLIDKVDEVLDWLMEIEENEENEDFKSKLIELIGDSNNPKAIALMSLRLKSPLYEVRSWAYSSLCFSELKECKQIAENFKNNNPNEKFL